MIKNALLSFPRFLQSRVRALTEMQAPLEELRELVEEAEGLPAAMPEVEHIQVNMRVSKMDYFSVKLSPWGLPAAMPEVEHIQVRTTGIYNALVLGENFLGAACCHARGA